MQRRIIRKKYFFFLIHTAQILESQNLLIIERRMKYGCEIGKTSLVLVLSGKPRLVTIQLTINPTKSYLSLIYVQRKPNIKKKNAAYPNPNSVLIWFSSKVR